ncbi:sigma-70 family RNA polymerase sigma factor [Luteimonas sp. SJ-92]|uniref:Sigma-70 family RNA polymerase sigma factor n=1 Tax=Luteimonas salinisoli TaxID=2752307 RepID=A0A853JBU0_9GAMM|nr:sigma-70 family RNA polymerase sigma factor [Luteimonas salinisoli]NZA26232.1 sigma-70 family RNA polymerase sigma factor [Luteimonas salinisoli]
MTMQEQAWADALRRERAGDASRYAGFLKEYSAVLRRIVRGRLASAGLDAQEAEDIVQEVLLAIHQRRDQWDDSRPLLPWLGAISRYKTIDAMRRRASERRMRIGLSDREWANLFAAQGEPAVGSPARIEEMVSALPRVEQSVVRKLGMEGMSPREAAQATGMKEGTVRVAFHRGLARLLKLALGGGS